MPPTPHAPAITLSGDTPNVTLSGDRLWLASARTELTTLVLGALLPASLLVPYLLVGPAIVGPAFVLHVVLLSLPHHALTLFKSAPRTSRTPLFVRDASICLLAALALSAIAAFAARSFPSQVVVTAIGLLSVWHIYRQHLGLCRIYSALQRRRSGDTTLDADLAELPSFLAVGSFAMIALLFSRPELRWDNGGGTVAEPVYTPLPALTPWLVYALLAFLAARIALRIHARVRAGRFVPWPQLLTAVLGVAVNNLPFLVVPTDATLLVVTIASSFHIAQYFAFVWAFERARSPQLPEHDRPLPQRAAARGRIAVFFGLALAYSLLVVLTVPLSATLFGSPELGVFFVTLSNVLHYLVDGVVWRRTHDPSVERALARLATSTA